VKTYNKLSEIQADIKAGKTSVAHLVDYYIQNIQKNKDLNAFLEVFDDTAKKRSVEVDEKIKSGRAGKLAGMVIAIKDNICFAGHKVTASSKIIENFRSLYSSTAVDRLLAEDAVIIGRTNCDEFAMGGSNEHSAFGPVKNPHDKKRVTGGSSGGSAAAVAADLCLAALGSDTGGSIRQPASFCGVVGLKPTYGRISRYGLIAYASSFDQIGTFTRSAEDAAILLDVMAGKDENDSTSSSHKKEDYISLLKEEKKYRIAYISDYLDKRGLSSNIKERIKNLITQLKAAGHTVEAVEFPYLEYMVPAYYVLTTAEASSNLSRYGGVLYGYRSPMASDIDSTFRKSRSEGFGKEVKRRIMLGTFVLSAGYYEAYYARAQKLRRVLRDKTMEIFKDYDLILTPTTPNVAFEIGAIADPVAMYLEDIFTVHANLAGIPAISIPAGQNKENMPFGLQLMAPPFMESSLLNMCNNIIHQEFIHI
jgi:aspartyl-tRNA(Asn)/glutamyl-tRNA(Gln) amidotransferase subunit A